MLLRIETEKWGYEARLFGDARDDIAACIAPTVCAAIAGLRSAVAGLPNGKRRDNAIAFLNTETGAR